MEEKIEKIIELAGNKNRYQIILLFLTVLIWINVDIIPISLPFLEKTPDVTYTDADGIIKYSQLNYTLCEMENKIKYNITKTYGFSWVIEYEVYCNRLITGLIGSVCFFGSFISSFLFQYTGTKFGRKNTVILNLILFCLILIIFYFSINIKTVMILIFLIQLTPGSVCLGSYMLCMESISNEKRSFYGAFINSGFCICGVVYILLYMYLNNWRYVFLISSFTSFICGVFYFFYSVESPRYYISKGDVDGFVNALNIIADRNGIKEEFNRKLNDDKSDFKKILDEIYLHYKNLNKNRKNVRKNKNLKEKELLLEDSETELDLNPKHKHKILSSFSLLKFASQRYKFLISCFLWFCVSGNYYGLTVYMKNLPGDIYVNGILIYTFEMISYFFSGFIINTRLFGRKGAISFYYIISIIGYFFLMIISNSVLIQLILTFSTRFAVAGVFNILYTYTSEIYPTVLRAQGFAYNSAFGKIGSILFPLLIEIFAQYVNLLFVAMNCICFCLLLFMPETFNKPLPDNVPELEVIKT